MTVARIAIGFGMTVVAYDPYANPAIAAASNVTLKESMTELFPIADFFTIHTPLLPTTKGMISTAELSSMKPTARIMNVARGGMIDEEALLEALNAGKLAGAGIDVFTSEPPAPDSSAARLLAHPKVVSTPHLGASTREAQENVSIDVCEQVLHIISGQLPRSAVNAPIILPEEYRTLQPFVTLVERMGTIYTQHYGSKHLGGIKDFRTTFDLTYEGALASLNTTKPLFAALIKGLVSPISADVNVNLVNAELVAKERGMLINEFRSREPLEEEGFSSYVTLRARIGRSSSQPPTPGISGVPRSEQIIQGYVSHNTPYISRLDRFRTNFVPEGNLLICRNIDTPGKIGLVGMKLGEVGCNINSMTVARLEDVLVPSGEKNEALMILGVDRMVEKRTVEDLVNSQGILEGSIITL
jgi:D-3-phosphoglycerate dehydrogenase / 2-oxoglutarate reductase